MNLQQWAMGRNACAGVALCSSAARCVVCDDGAQILGDSGCHLRGNPFFQDGLRCDTWTHAVETPIRYAPDLNPDELVCSHAKRTGVARSPLKAGENLQCRVDAQLQNIADNPALVKAFFRHPSVSYITDW